MPDVDCGGTGIGVAILQGDWVVERKLVKIFVVPLELFCMQSNRLGKNGQTFHFLVARLVLQDSVYQNIKAVYKNVLIVLTLKRDNSIATKYRALGL